MFDREQRIATVDASCMQLIYSTLHATWIDHARQELEDISWLLR